MHHLCFPSAAALSSLLSVAALHAQPCGSAYLSYMPACYGPLAQITVEGEYDLCNVGSSWDTNCNGTFNVGAGPHTWTFQCGSAYFPQTVTVPPLPECEITAEFELTTAPSCFGCTDGAGAFVAYTNACEGYRDLWYNVDRASGEEVALTGLATGNYTMPADTRPSGCQASAAFTVPLPPCPETFPIPLSIGHPTPGGQCADGSIAVDNSTWPEWLVRIQRDDGTTLVNGWSSSMPPLDGLVPGRYHLRAQKGAYDPVLDANRTCELWKTIYLGGPGCSPAAIASPKVMLDGAYSVVTGGMTNALASNGLIPLLEPYTAIGYEHIGGGGGEQTVASVLSATGPLGIVDWVVLELRDLSDPTYIWATRSALLRSDGQIVDVDGTSPVRFEVNANLYYLAVRHRNHLGIMTAMPVDLSNGVVLVDLTAAGAAFGQQPTRAIGGIQTLWCGDVQGNGRVSYTGTLNDRDPILLAVGSTTPNAVIGGYLEQDVNLDGLVKYTGSGNDRDPILGTVGSTTPNSVRLEQLP